MTRRVTHIASGLAADAVGFAVEALRAAKVTVDRGVGTQLLVRAPGPIVRDVKITDLDLLSFSTGGQLPV